MIRPTAMIFALCTCVSAQAMGLGNVFGALVGGAGDTGHGATEIDSTLRQLTQQINRRTPMKVDADTRLDRVNAEPGPRLVYEYTLVGMRSDQVSEAALRKALTPALHERLCAAGDVRGFLRNGVSLSYAYRGSDGKPIGDISFTPDACAQGYQAGGSGPTVKGPA